ncbi:MAG: UDP-N-acetylmuramate dehydrogenase [Proteocatella sp.]
MKKTDEINRAEIDLDEIKLTADKMKLVIDELKKVVNDNQICENELMKNHTTFRIGGCADIMIFPNTEKEIIEIIELAKKHEIQYTVVGNGSNILVTDKGIRGIVIKIADNFSKSEIKDNIAYAESGIRLTALSRKIMESELSGFEFASGIPGTVGGGVFMNAGAYDSEMKNIVKKVRVIDKSGKIKEIARDDMEFGYRKSIFMKKDYIILSVWFELEPGKKEEIKSKTDDFTNRRTTKQPISEYSAGSTFKRPEGNFAGRLIEESGLRGYSTGDAKVSEKHCGFVINKGNSTYKEMIDFIEEVKSKVYQNTGIKLEEEIKIIGEK